MSGVSIPMNTLMKQAARMRERSSSSSAMLIEACVNTEKGFRRRTIQSARRGSSVLMAVLFPAKLSSTMNTEPRQPRT